MKKMILSIGILSISSMSAWSGSLWQDVSTNIHYRHKNNPEYRPLTTDIVQLKSLLANAPLQNSGLDGVVIDLPLPDGQFTRVTVFESPILAPAIAQLHPDIKTFKVFGLDDQAISGRLDLTPAGFHGLLHTNEGIVYINPESIYTDTAPANRYRSISKSARQPSTPFICHTANHPQLGTVITGNHHNSNQSGLSIANKNIASKNFGATLRTYRLALSATREYSMAVAGGNLNKTYAEMVTAINRVNEVYEKDVAVTLQLVTGTELISTRTSDFSNDDGDVLLSENQLWIDKITKPANYDIGHIFSTGGGGIASIAAVCDDDIDGPGDDLAFKAQGVTGSDNPTTDAFYIDYVAHEIGHQFGASHTFNAIGDNAGFCDGNRAPNIENGSTFLAASAYETGSGSTIMSYAGICDTQDLQEHSDAYFHARSIEQIREFVDGDIASTFDWADGSICGSESSTGDIPPVANAGNDFTIPGNTPFVLTGAGTDSDSDIATFNYTWEQYDLGMATTSLNAMHSDKGKGPLIRSQAGSNNPERYIPSLNAILAGDLELNMGERLPTTDRSMTFRLTLRSGSHGVDQDDMTITVDRDAGPFLVTSPTNTNPFSGLQHVDVNWNVAHTTSSPVNCSLVDILLSNDGGNTFNTTLLSETPNDGNAEVILPNINTNSARIKVACHNNIFFNVNPGNFTINSVENSVSITGSTAQNEGDSGTTNFSFLVTLAQPASTTVTVDYRVLGTETNGTDISDFGNSFPSGTLTFLTGEQQKTVTIPVISDSLAEADEKFSVSLLNAANTGIGTGTATGTIINDDTTTTLSISAVTAEKDEGDNGTTQYRFTLSRLGVSNITSSVTYSVTGSGTHPVNSDDFPNGFPAPEQISFFAGETSKTIIINMLGDTQKEDDETLMVTLSDPVNGVINQATASSIILNDDTLVIHTKKDSGSGKTDLMLLLALTVLLMRTSLKRKNNQKTIHDIYP